MSDESLGIRVECRDDQCSEEMPHRFWLGAREVGVVDVLDRWLAADHRYFKIRGDDGDVYILRHDLATGRWELTLFHRGG